MHIDLRTSDYRFLYRYILRRRKIFNLSSSILASCIYDVNKPRYKLNYFDPPLDLYIPENKLLYYFPLSLLLYISFADTRRYYDGWLSCIGRSAIRILQYEILNYSQSDICSLARRWVAASGTSPRLGTRNVRLRRAYIRDTRRRLTPPLLVGN